MTDSEELKNAALSYVHRVNAAQREFAARTNLDINFLTNEEIAAMALDGVVPQRFYERHKSDSFTKIRYAVKPIELNKGDEVEYRDITGTVRKGRLIDTDPIDPNIAYIARTDGED